MLPPQALRKALPALPRIPLRGPWYRAVNYDHLVGPPPGSPAVLAPQPLWPGGAARKGARFTPRMPTTAGAQPPGASGIDCLYLAEDELTPVLEIAGVLRPAGSRVPLRFEPQVIMTVDGVLTDVLDLTDVSTQQALGTTHQELTGAWLVQQSRYLAGQGPPPPTQLLGQEAFGVRHVVALRYPSSKNPTGVGLVVFTGRLRPNQHSLAVFNQRVGKLQQSLP
ncbi:MAG: RES family NAD+ phosphorylase [Vicinamibacterales bacterium]